MTKDPLDIVAHQYDFQACEASALKPAVFG